ncbi:hypothetical protein [Mycolicibacter minnesotensis]
MKTESAMTDSRAADGAMPQAVRDTRTQLWCLAAAAAVGVVIFPLIVLPMIDFHLTMADARSLTFPLNGLVLPRTYLSAEEIAQQYAEHRVRFQLAALGMAIGVVPFCVLTGVVGARIRRMEKGFPIFSVLWWMSSVLCTMTPILMSLCLALAAYRPGDIDPEITRMLNDLEWLVIIYTWPIFNVASFSSGVAILRCERGKEIAPRWVGYVGLATGSWCPAGLTAIFVTGPFAYDGIFGTYLPLALLFTYYNVFFPSVIIGMIKEVRDARRAMAVADLS